MVRSSTWSHHQCRHGHIIIVIMITSTFYHGLSSLYLWSRHYCNYGHIIIVIIVTASLSPWSNQHYSHAYIHNRNINIIVRNVTFIVFVVVLVIYMITISVYMITISITRFNFGSFCYLISVQFILITKFSKQPGPRFNQYLIRVHITTLFQCNVEF